jgi:DNA polymerase I
MKNEAGESTNAVLGFSSMIINVLLKYSPDFLAVCFDKKGKTFRHEEYTEYKATRTKAPDDLYAQFPKAKEFLKAFSVPFFELEGFEADDLIATLKTKAEQIDNIKTVILTSDRDALQLITEKTTVLAPIKGVSEMIEFDEKTVFEKYQLTPSQMADYKGLFGDNSDNIKGVPGVGQKTAQKLLAEYKTLENVYENIDKIKGSLKEKLLTHKESAVLSKRIATLILDAPINLDLEKSQIYDFDSDFLEYFLNEMGFRSLVKRTKQLIDLYNKKKNEEKFVQNALF